MITSINSRQIDVLAGLLYIKGIRIHLLGFDANEDPVVQVTDANGLGEPWAIRRTDQGQRFYHEPTGDIRSLTDEEQDNFDHHALELLDRVYARR